MDDIIEKITELRKEFGDNFIFIGEYTITFKYIDEAPNIDLWTIESMSSTYLIVSNTLYGSKKRMIPLACIVVEF